MTRDAVTLLETKRFRVVEVQEERAGKTLRRAVIRHPGSVVIVPLIDENQVCLIRNYRVSVGATLLELPAGTLEEGESPEATGRRELIEETGYQAQEFLPLHAFFPSPGILDERMHLFVARGLRAGTPEREAGEEIENFVLGWNEALDLIYSGEIRDAKTIAGLLFYDGWRKRRQA